MRTPIEFKKNLDEGKITLEMLGMAAYSVNKRAKNYRDAEQNYWRYKPKYSAIARERKEDFYRKKDTLLSIVDPVCFHLENSGYTKRIYDTEPDWFEQLENKTVVYSNEFFDEDLGDYCTFYDVWEEQKNLYRFYKIAGFSFHSPVKFGISEEEISTYMDDGMNVCEIDEIQSEGSVCTGLISAQFAYKVVELINSGNYELVE